MALQLLKDGKTFADIKHSVKKLGYDPKKSINEGVPKFINWFMDYNL